MDVPTADPVGGIISSITFKCWGAGGGSGGIAAYGALQGGNISFLLLFLLLLLFIVITIAIVIIICINVVVKCGK